MTSRILLADDSPHAQRMGERILREEGFEVVTVTDGDTVLHRLEDVRPDVILLDAFLPKCSGYDLCRKIKSLSGHGRAAVVLVGGLLEPVNEEQARAVGADAILKKPFEATTVLETVRSLIGKANQADGGNAVVVLPVAEMPVEAVAAEAPAPVPAPPEAEAAVAKPDPELIRAAVTVALDRAMPAMIDEITARVLRALSDAAPGSSITESE